MTEARGRRFRVAVGAALLLATLLPAAVASGASPAAAGALPADATSWIVTLKAGAASGKLAPGLAKAAGGKSDKVYGHALNGFVFKGSAKAAAALRNNPNVRTIVADGKVHLLGDTITTGISRIRADHPTEPSAYAAGFRGAGVRVAILDTGIDLTHPDLVPNLDIALGRNCITAGPPQDGHGHGTHVAGIVAAAANGLGVVGVAPEARLVPFKVLDDTGNGEWSNLICAIDYLTGLMTDGNPNNDIRVANMSLGDTGSVGSCTDGGVREAICRSVAAGVVYVAAAGNSTTDTSTFIPAAFPEVITVSALTDLDGEPGGLGGCWLFFFYCDDTLAEFSNYGAVVDVTAPGTQIYSDWTGGGYATEMGTSMAAPHVAGVAALVLAAHPSLTPAAVETLLKSTGECPNGEFADADGSGDCTGKGQWGNDPDGYGEPLVNALHAVEGPTAPDAPPVIHITSPVAGTRLIGSVQVTADATDDLGVAKVEFFVDGTLLATDTNGSDGWATTWDTTTAVDGIHTLKATATDTTGHRGSESISVRTGANLQGDWVGAYGADGYVLGDWTGNGDLASLPAGVSYVVEQASRYSWAAPSADVRALQAPDRSERRAQTWYDGGQIRIRLNFTNAYSGNLHLYAVDWDSLGRLEDLTVNDGSGPQTQRLTSSFVPGAWRHFPITVSAGGSVLITVDRTAGMNAVLSGLFLGDAGPPPVPPPPPGNWVGTYGADGYILGNWTGSGDLAALPSGVTFAVEQGARYSWASPTADIRGLESPDRSERRARTWSDGSQIRIRLNFTNAYSGTLHLYAVDWDSYGRLQDVVVDDGAGTQTQRLTTSFVPGAWLHFPVTVPAAGSLVIRVNRTAGINAVLSGIFLGGAGTPPPPPPPPPPPTTDRPGVQGTWVGTYGLDGYVLADWTGSTDLVALPAGVTYVVEQGSRYSWAAPSTDVRALQAPDRSERRARTWYDGGQIRIRLNFTNAYSGNLHVYAVDWDSYGRLQDVTVDDGAGGRTARLTTSFVPGAWIHFPITVAAGRSVLITVDRTAGINAVLSGLFLGDGAPPTVPGAPTGLGATPGNGQVALAWTAPASNGGSAITGYTATASPGGAACTSATLGCTVSGLANGTTYSFTVSASNAVGPGPASAPVSATPVAPPSVPGAPTGLSATPGNGQVALAWTAPASNGGSAITGFSIYRGTTSGAETLLTTVGVVAGYTDTGLTNGTTYYYQVAAQNAIGGGARSTEVSARPATVPTAPRSVTAARNATKGVTLTWVAPLSNGGAAVTGYRIYRSTTSGAETFLLAVGNVLRYVDAATTAGVRYYYQVSAVNPAGEGPRSTQTNAIAR